MSKLRIGKASLTVLCPESMNKRLVVHYIKNFTCQDKHNQNKKTTQTRTTSIMYTKEKELVILMYKKLRRKRQTTLKKRCRYLFF